MRVFNPKSPVVAAGVDSMQGAFALENYFDFFRNNIVGHHHSFDTPYGQKKIIYADWVASGRLYRPIEEKMFHELAPFIGNTHTETNVTGTSMTLAYHEAQQIIKKHVNACDDDALLMVGSGMTGAVNKFQRLLGLKQGQKYELEKERPIVFVTLLEHHSNDVSWRETSAEVVAIDMDAKGNVDVEHLKELLEIHKDRLFKIAAVSACSNVTGVETPYHDIAKIMHQHGGLCFVDFACSAPYVAMDMHPEDEEARLDAIYFSMHKFLGGPGTPGVLVFHRSLYGNSVPDHPGGGTVTWVDRWGEQRYIAPTNTHGIEAREDGGTPAFLQTIRAGLCVQLKDQMGVANIMAREKQLLPIAFHELRKAKGLHILADNVEHRLGVVSFYIEGLHYNLGVKLLNDRYGIQVRGGCSCAGPYGHCLLDIDLQISKNISQKIEAGDFTSKPGWIRLSIHPTLTNAELYYITNAIREMAAHFSRWGKDYTYNPISNEFVHKKSDECVTELDRVKKWFVL